MLTLWIVCWDNHICWMLTLSNMQKGTKHAIIIRCCITFRPFYLKWNLYLTFWYSITCFDFFFNPCYHINKVDWFFKCYLGLPVWNKIRACTHLLCNLTFTYHVILTNSLFLDKDHYQQTRQFCFLFFT